jgi:uncharacterized RDD family membrane protein YckC
MKCTGCDKEIVPDSHFCTWCSRFIPVPELGSKANLFARWIALWIDPLIGVASYMLALTLMAGVSADLATVGVVLFPLGYFLWFLTLLRKGQTPGKMLLGLQVVHYQTGRIPGFGRMLLREIVGRFLSGLFFGLGYLWAIFDKNSQAWHDKLAGTVVLRLAPGASKRVAAEESGMSPLMIAVGLVSIVVAIGVVVANLSSKHNAQTAATSLPPGRWPVGSASSYAPSAPGAKGAAGGLAEPGGLSPSMVAELFAVRTSEAGKPFVVADVNIISGAFTSAGRREAVVVFRDEAQSNADASEEAWLLQDNQGWKVARKLAENSSLACKALDVDRNGRLELWTEGSSAHQGQQHMGGALTRVGLQADETLFENSGFDWHGAGLVNDDGVGIETHQVAFRDANGDGLTDIVDTVRTVSFEKNQHDEVDLVKTGEKRVAHVFHYEGGRFLAGGPAMTGKTVAGSGGQEPKAVASKPTPRAKIAIAPPTDVNDAVLER